jgi:type II secretory pathway pseudopilin PulG
MSFLKAEFKKKPINGFTLIEVLVVVSLTVMIILTASALFMTFLISGSKASNIQLLKLEGDYAINQMTYMLRNAIALQPNSAVPPVSCGSNMTNIVVKSIDGGVTTLSSVNDTSDGDATKIASTSGTTSVFLTSKAVQIVEGPTFDCAATADGSGPYVTISFKLRKGTPNLDRERDIVEQTFTTGVSLRNL